MTINAAVWCVIFVACFWECIVKGKAEMSSPDSSNGYRLARDASYFIVAPRKVRPNEVYQMSVSVLSLNQMSSLDVRAVIKRYDEEIARVNREFNLEGVQMFQMWIPDNAIPGNYSLSVTGSTNGGLGGYIFHNETDLTYDGKQASLFIELNKPFYRQGQLISFRVLPIEANLMSRSGSMDVYIEDATKTTVKRWLSMQTNAGGVLEMRFQLSDQPHYGDWKVRVKAWGHWYEKDFRVDEFWVTAIDVNVSMPLYIWEDDFALAGSISANCSLAQPVQGTIVVKLEVRLPLSEQDPSVDYQWPTIERESRFFPGVIDFMYTLDEVRGVAGGSVRDKELYVEANVFDWFRAQGASGWSLAVVHSNELEVKLLGDQARTFKPNQTMNVYWAVFHQDGTPLHRPRRQIVVTGTEEGVGGTRNIDHVLLVRDDGIAHFRYSPREGAEFIKINAYYDTLMAQSVEMTAMRHYSPTQSYLYITTSTETPMVDHYMVFTITTNVFVQQVYYLILAGGNIITGSMLDMKFRQRTFSIALSRDMIPEAHIIAWHIHKGEVVADSMNFFVNGTRINKIHLRLNEGKDFSGDTVEVNAWTDPSSYIGFSAMDYDLWSIGYNTFITETDIITELRTYDKYANHSFTHKWKLPNEQDQLVHFPAPNYGIDANTTFEYAGLLVFTDANVTRIPHFCNETLGWFPCMDGTCYAVEQRCDRVRQCRDGQDEMGCEFPEPYRFTLPRDRLGLVTRHYTELAEWFWGGHFVMPNGRLDVRSTIPDEPYCWLGSAFAISRTLGFGILHEPIRNQATRDIYMRAEGPSSIVKGEQVGVRLSLFNWWGQDVEALVMLHSSPQYRFVVVEEYGIVSSYSPRTRTGDILTMVFLENGAVVELQMPVLPVVEGCIEVTVSAFTILYKDTETIEMCTQYDGVTNTPHTPYFLDLINSGSLVLPDLMIPVPDRFIKPEERQHLYVPGSPECSVGVVGDVVGAGFFKDSITAEDTLHQPFGSAEQNMYNFAYRLYNLKYQRATNQLKRDVQHRELDNLNLDFQRQLGYMNRDGSFSMFRDYQNYTPSTWVTAYTLRTLNDANERDWELDFFIPTELLNRIALWLCQQQDPRTGAFFENAPLYDRKLWPKEVIVDGGVTKPANYSLTAYVLISLARADKVTGEADACRGQAIRAAQTYLENALTSLTDVYTVALTTYGLHLVGSSESTKALDKLRSMQRQNQYIYWADKDVPENNVSWVDSIPFYQPRVYLDNEAYAVETTAYAMLSLLLQNRLSESTPSMKWLQSMRNTFAGQASTQDSAVALEALVEYAKLDTNRALYNIEVTLLATSMGNFSHKVRLDQSNWPTQQEVKVFPVWGSVRGRAQGTGLALMQLTTRVNVEYPHQIWPQPINRFFDVEISEWSFTGMNFSIMEVTPCARWARPDLSNHSGLAVLEMYVPTGYVITNDVLRAYAQSGDVPTLRRAEAVDRRVIFYFDYLEHMQRTCVHIRLDRWFPVANMTIQHKLRVFDYYEPGMHNTTLYNTWHLFNLHICQVCGSFQCPYCRYYNSAPPLRTHLLISVVTSLSAAIAITWVTRSHKVS